MMDMLDSKEFKLIVPVEKGLSPDRKYYIESLNGGKLFLRVSDISQLEKKKYIFTMMQQMDEIGVPMSRPVSFGLCNGGRECYALFTWCSGEDMESVINNYSNDEQYSLGIEVGKALRKIHSVPVPVRSEEDWQARFYRQIQPRLDSYTACGITVPGDKEILGYLEANRHLLRQRPQCYLHGDYHMGNIMLDAGSPDEEPDIAVIDWDTADFDNYGDPWREFYNIGGIATTNPYFATGQINGYFQGDVPLDFWSILAFYMAEGAISAVPWATRYGQKMIKEILALCKNVLYWFDNMQSTVPVWYIRGL